MFIKNDVLQLKKLDIFTLTFSVYVDSYKTIISIFIKHRFVF